MNSFIAHMPFCISIGLYKVGGAYPHHWRGRRVGRPSVAPQRWGMTDVRRRASFIQLQYSINNFANVIGLFVLSCQFVDTTRYSE